MPLFNIIRNPHFFSLLSSPNRDIYVVSLFVVYRCYKQEFIPLHVRFFVGPRSSIRSYGCVSLTCYGVRPALILYQQ
ncbi:MAG: hypothetical protein A4E53_02252 [Pelotomaculum sp. PtaB.Bin104]|nr:MAG: hypothetical protein A4E53_02252 [Pelotomaculum sp. PtaB.Bin104]